MIVECAHCGELISRKPSQVRRCRQVFCTRACINARQRTGSSVVCVICGKRFYKSPSKLCVDNLCSSDCRNVWLGRRNVEIMNVSGHTAGHKAPHLTRMNRIRNPLASLSNNGTNVDSAMYRKVVEECVGRKLLRNEVVHHINGDRSDNRVENLAIMTVKEHRKLHMMIAIKRYNAATGGDHECQKNKPNHEALPF